MQALADQVDWILSAPLEDLETYDVLLEHLCAVGLFHDDRKSPDDPSKSIYGDDVQYMLPKDQTYHGMWQTPSQLARALLTLKDLGIRTYLDIGTFSGWTVSVVTAFLMRYGLERVDSYDIIKYCQCDDLWRTRNMPITYCLNPRPEDLLPRYDLVFIDGNHETGVYADYACWKGRARVILFHDIQDHFCPSVVDCWNKAKQEPNSSEAYEFTMHPNGFRLMGIGLIVSIQCL